MAITITKKPTNPCFSKNVIAWQVQTDTTFKVIAWIYVESSPYSETYQFVTALSAIPDEDGYCYYYLQDLLEQDVLSYHKPSFSNTAEAWPNVCRRLKVSFYELDPTNLVLHDEAYSVTGADITITELTVGKNYTIITDKEVDEVKVKTSGGSSVLFGLQHSLNYEYWYKKEFVTDAYSIVEAEAGVKYTIYEGKLPAFTENEDRFALFGGIEFNRFTKLIENAVLWGEENYDLIVDENGNFVGIT